MECRRVMIVNGPVVVRCGKPGESVSVPGAYEVLCAEHRHELDQWLAKMNSLLKPKRKRTRKNDGAMVWLSLQEMQAKRLEGV